MKPSNIIGNQPSAVVCELQGDRKSIGVVARNERGQLLTRVGVESMVDSTPVGFEIMKSALLAWLIGEFRKAYAVHIDFPLDPRSFDFLNQLTSKVIGDLSDARPPSLSVSRLRELKPLPRSLVQNNVAAGYSGGRDSSMSIELLKECGFAVQPYTISYDHFDPNKRFSTTQTVELSDPYYESFDIPVTYLAPLWNTHDRTPEFISVGHSFDVLGFESSQRRAPYESPSSMRIHQAYLQALLGTQVKFLFPLATLSTYSVFELTRRRSGLSGVESKISCWNSNDGDCGYCDKCQRVKLASSSMHERNYAYLPDMPQVVEDHSFLFGHPGYGDLVSKHGADSVAESQLFCRNLQFDPRIAEHLARTFEKKQISVETCPDLGQPKEANIQPVEIAQKIGIDYKELPSDCVNTCTKDLPYEGYFGRESVALSSYGEHPSFNGSGWSYRRVSEGPRLEVPDTPLFRNFLNH